MRSSTDPAVNQVKVAAVQFDMQVGVENKQANLAASIRHINDAAANGARLIVLPELASTGYSFDTKQEAYEHAEDVPTGPTCQA